MDSVRCADRKDGMKMKLFNHTHTQTYYLLTYPVEHSYSAEDEAGTLRRKTDSVDEIELLAFVDGAIVGSAGIGCVARKEKTRHRAGARLDAAGVIKTYKKRRNRT